MSNCSDIPTHVVFSSTVIIRTTDKDEDGVVHGCVVNDADDDDLSSIDDVSCMSEDNASLEHIRVGLYNFVIESTYNDLEDFGPPPVAVSTATKDGIDVDNNDNDNDDDNDDDEISAISKSSSIRDREVVITSSIVSSFEKQKNNITDCCVDEEDKSSIFSSYFPNTNPEYDNNDETTPSLIDVPIVMNNYHRSDDDDTTLSYVSSSNIGCSTLLQRRRKRRNRSHSNNSVHTNIEYIQHQAMKPIRRASTVASWSARRLRSVLHNPFLFQQQTKNKRKKNQSVLLSNDDHDDDCILSIAPTMIPVESFELGSDEEERNARSHHDH
mmetsp:Transcript_19970/g.21409  ORF Transcript_19970/g.21409 Transcript_19970/m.21409 type:complete len:326 (+) Transcript_19970:98-1075(+)